MNSAVFITGLIAAIVLLIVVCFYKNHIADLTQNLRKADDKSKDWEYSFNVLKSRSKSLHCRTCPKRTAPHYKKDCGEQGDHCCDEYGRRLCDCVTPTDPRGESGAGRL